MTKTDKISLINLNNSYSSIKPIFDKLFKFENDDSRRKILKLENKYFTGRLQLEESNVTESQTESNEPLEDPNLSGIILTINDQTNVQEIEKILSSQVYENCKLKLVVYDSDLSSDRKGEILSIIFNLTGELIDLNDLLDGETSEDLLLQSFNGISDWDSIVMKKISSKVSSTKKIQVAATKPPEEKPEETPQKSTNDPQLDISSKEVDQLEAMFSQFSELKSQADGLSGQERLDFAEKVVGQFMNALGIDEEESEGEGI